MFASASSMGSRGGWPVKMQSEKCSICAVKRSISANSRMSLSVRQYGLHASAVEQARYLDTPGRADDLATSAKGSSMPVAR